MNLTLVCSECGVELKAKVEFITAFIRVWPCSCQKPKPKNEYEPVFIEAKVLGGLPHD